MSGPSYAAGSTPTTSGASVETVAYFEHPLMPGKPMFSCARMSSNLQVTTCAGMWAEANTGEKPPEKHMRCKGCALGAAHAGVAPESVDNRWAKSMCSRCGGKDKRLIGGTTCVSCKNREYEWVKGKNAKGREPVTHPQLDKRRIRYVEGGVVKTMCRPYTTSTDELVIDALRGGGKKIVLGRGCGRAGGFLMEQGEA